MMLYPYFGWIIFMIYLNGYILMNNPKLEENNEKDAWLIEEIKFLNSILHKFYKCTSKRRKIIKIACPL